MESNWAEDFVRRVMMYGMPGVDEPKFAAELRARVGEPDDGEPVDVESLERMGFKGEPDEADTDVYDLQSANGGPTIRVWLRFRRGEIVESGMKLAWSYQSPGLPKVSMSHVITDNPTNGDVRKLISALGIALQEGRTDGK